MKPFWHVRAVGGEMMLMGMFPVHVYIYKTATVPGAGLRGEFLARLESKSAGASAS